MTTALPPMPIDYATPVPERRRRWFAWLPATCVMLLASAVPAYGATVGDFQTYVDLYRDFGLKLPYATDRTLAYVLWFGPGYGWILCVAFACLSGVVVALVRPRPRPASPWRAMSMLLACVALSLILVLAASRAIEGGPIWVLLRGITSGGGR